MTDGPIASALHQISDGLPDANPATLAEENEMLRALLREAAQTMEHMDTDQEVSLRVEAARLTGGDPERAKRLYKWLKTGE